MKFAANKKFEGKEIEVRKASKTSNGNYGGKKKSKAPSWFVEFVNKQNQFNEFVIEKLNSIDQRLDNLVVKNNLKE